MLAGKGGMDGLRRRSGISYEVILLDFGVPLGVPTITTGFSLVKICRDVMQFLSFIDGALLYVHFSLIT